MSMKKQFVTPRVNQQVPIQLEKDLLQGSVQNVTKLESMGIASENFDFSDSQTEYTVEWYD